jgi:hypothetical protein
MGSLNTHTDQFIQSLPVTPAHRIKDDAEAIAVAKLSISIEK